MPNKLCQKCGEVVSSCWYRGMEVCKDCFYILRKRRLSKVNRNKAERRKDNEKEN
jgi:hypothetical protein